MTEVTRRRTARLGRPLSPVVLAVPTVCFVGTLLTDLAYWKSAEIMWADFSAWLVSTGVVFGVVALIVWVLDLLRGPFVRAQLPRWPYAIAYLIALVLGVINMFIHTRDAWTSVVPWGLALSAIVAVILLVPGWMGRTVVYREQVAVREIGVAP